MVHCFCQLCEGVNGCEYTQSVFAVFVVVVELHVVHCYILM